MLKRTINVPKGIRYISEWKDFKLEDYQYILDKKIPGCGFTEWCLTNNQPTVLCSPRRILLQNKFDQHKNDVYYLKNDFEKMLEIEKDLTRIDKRVYNLNPVETAEEKEAKKKFYQEATKNLLGYVNARQSRSLPPKILVTYDSFHIVKDILKNALLLYDFQIIVDEFQSLLVDARFKPNTELSFMSQLNNLKKVCFVSATPMMDEYLDKIDEFKFLPYHELDWGKLDPARVVKPKLTVRVLRSVPEMSKNIIDEYKSGNFVGKYVLDKSGNPVYVESKEAVIYVNSVNNIISVIRTNELKPEEVNILIANTEENQKKIRRKLGKKYLIGSVPLKGEPHKMFTLCTRTVYLGADFYSTNARTFILSDANIETLAVDISLDLPQILGRQRLNINPWKNEAFFYYRSLFAGKKIDKKILDARVAEKLRKTASFIASFQDASTKLQKDDLAERFEEFAMFKNYKDDYVAVDKKFNVVTMTYDRVPVQNNLVLIAEQRAYDIQQIDYADRFTVFNTLDKVTGNAESRTEIKEFFEVYDKLLDIPKKLKYLCESSLSSEFIKSAILPNIKEPHFDEYFTVLGSEKCKARGYNVTRLKKELGIVTFSTELLELEIYKEFKENQRISSADAKEKLQKIYDLVGYSKKAKATDLSNYFEVKEIILVAPKRARGFELIKKLK